MVSCGYTAAVLFSGEWTLIISSLVARKENGLFPVFVNNEPGSHVTLNN